MAKGEGPSQREELLRNMYDTHRIKLTIRKGEMVNLILRVSVYFMFSLQDERQERIQASLREREREVAISHTALEKEWGKGRDQFRKTEAQEVFKALLVDMV